MKVILKAFNKNFKDYSLSWDLTENQLQDLFDEEVSKWHYCDDLGVDCKLHEFLGMTWDEYCKVATRPSDLTSLVGKWREELSNENTRT